MAITARKRNPQDATLRNVRALKKRIAALARRLKVVETVCRRLHTR